MSHEYMRCVTLKVYGHVQGVFFRSSAQERARALKINGYASNMRDGSVEVVACGEEAAVVTMIEFCRDNPGYSHVEEVVVEETQELADSVVDKGFLIR